MDLFLDILRAHGGAQIAICFTQNNELKHYIKAFEGVKWSTSHGVYYIPYSKENLGDLVFYISLRYYNFDHIKVSEYAMYEDRRIAFQKSHLDVLEAFCKWMEQQRYSQNTIVTYNSMLLSFFKYYYYKPLKEINQKDITRYNYQCIINKNQSHTTQNQTISALKLFFRKFNDFEVDIEDLERPNKARSLPEILSIQEVETLLNAVSNLKHKVLLSIIYSAGLRIGEALNLKIRSIDSVRMMIRIENAKGKKDRLVPLSEKLIFYLREYYKLYRPEVYLFEGKHGGKYTQSSSRSILKKALKRTAIRKRVTLHTLRHSYATHLLESGTDIRYIQELLGHNSPKTTMIYTHVSTKNMQNIKSPFDKLNL